LQRTLRVAFDVVEKLVLFVWLFAFELPLVMGLVVASLLDGDLLSRSIRLTLL
jgi:hypothetical protein